MLMMTDSPPYLLVRTSKLRNGATFRKQEKLPHENKKITFGSLIPLSLPPTEKQRERKKMRPNGETSNKMFSCQIEASSSGAEMKTVCRQNFWCMLLYKCIEYDCMMEVMSFENKW